MPADLRPVHVTIFATLEHMDNMSQPFVVVHLFTETHNSPYADSSF